MTMETVSFERATSSGWIPVTGKKVGPLAVASYIEKGFNNDEPIWEIFHINTGLVFSRQFEIHFETEERGIELAEKIADFPEWTEVKQDGHKPKSVVIPDLAKRNLVKKIREAWQDAT